ncbi:prolylcarboxypeptidase [Culex quinquefasciatus]|uniref:Prolylcarboxypeptidase n=1 Tax=Culex quinquefasciatus TaxID=7176 RepID=B0WP52_CULQU|nr:prolylcarboxypeptidase [Culex quinquefasciatus]|eukprot:XP_001850486.1 prolylcarboxypeptidase [Culex quinquefasciatus]
MVHKLVLLTLLVTAAAAFPERKPVKIAPIIEKMLKAYPIPEVPEDYDLANSRSVRNLFRTRVDHFNPQNRDTFELAYYSNDEFYRPGGPIFIFVGGNWAVNPYFIERGHFPDIAYMEGAWMFTNEHRYYGTSFPVEDLSTPNLRFLTVEQAMVDLAELIYHLRHNVVRDDNARVVLLGMGYGGAIATWMRQRYPHLVDGSWVSSGQVEARFNFKEHAVEVGELIRDHGDDECYSRIWRAFRTAEALMDAGRTEIVTDMFRTCDAVDEENMLDVETFFYNVKEVIQAEILLYQNVESTTRLCETLNDSDESTDLQTLASWVNATFSYFECLPFDFESTVEAHSVLDIDSIENRYLGLRQRVYQFCTEFGWFLTADSDDQPFGYRVTMYFFLNFCKATYGDWVTAEVVADGVHLTNMHFGGQDPRIANVLFINGGLDPVRDISITEYHAPRASAIVIPDYFGSADINSISGFNSPEMLEAKHQIHEHIISWLYEPVLPIVDNE